MRSRQWVGITSDRDHPTPIPKPFRDSFLTGSSSMTELIEVPSKLMWVGTATWVKAGDTLSFRADGTWVDAVIPCSADGYSAPLFYSINRLPRIPDDGRYFRLMGRIVPDGIQPQHDDVTATFPVGCKSERSVTTQGRLFVFANDRVGYYWNNWGSVTLRVDLLHPLREMRFSS